MRKVLEIIDAKGRKIHLTKERWQHISREHPNCNLECLEETLISPTMISNSDNDPKVKFYFRWYKNKRKYLLVAVKYLNNSGFVITSFYVKKMRK